jgi:hypothetical protein
MPIDLCAILRRLREGRGLPRDGQRVEIRFGALGRLDDHTPEVTVTVESGYVVVCQDDLVLESWPLEVAL